MYVYTNMYAHIYIWVQSMTNCRMQKIWKQTRSEYERENEAEEINIEINPSSVVNSPPSSHFEDSNIKLRFPKAVTPINPTLIFSVYGRLE